MSRRCQIGFYENGKQQDIKHPSILLFHRDGHSKGRIPGDIKSACEDAIKIVSQHHFDVTMAIGQGHYNIGVDERLNEENELFIHDVANKLIESGCSVILPCNCAIQFKQDPLCGIEFYYQVMYSIMGYNVICYELDRKTAMLKIMKGGQTE